MAVVLMSAYFGLQYRNTFTSVGERSFGEYKVISTYNTGLCGDDEVRDSNNVHIVTLNLCEDNIRTIEKEDDWVVITTGAGRTYKKNLETGEEILNSQDGIGGMSKVGTVSDITKSQDIVLVEMDDVHGLWGGFQVSVQSNGDTSVKGFYRGGRDIREYKETNIENFERLERALSENNFSEIKDVPPIPMPDQGSVEISATKSSGEKISVTQYQMTDDFRAIHKVFRDIA